MTEIKSYFLIEANRTEKKQCEHKKKTYYTLALNVE